MNTNQMITQTLNFAPTNPSIQKYTYSTAYQTIASSPSTFSLSSFVTNAMRAVYGYTTSSNIVAVELRLVSLQYDCPNTSALSVQNMVCINSNTTNFTRLASGPYNMIAPLNRIIGSTSTTGWLQTPVSTFFITKIPANYATSFFTYTVNNANTGVAISTADYILYNIEIIEYVSAY